VTYLAIVFDTLRIAPLVERLKRLLTLCEGHEDRIRRQGGAESEAGCRVPFVQ
jgi:hypothetical protein